ncbi:MAG: calcium/sodium antiporter [Caldilineaceae bacterium]|nr:calcium/sodium antiporter [Caldilineaceae bacterium]
MAQWLNDLIFFILGFILLTFGADFLVRGASRLAARMKVSPVVIGLTIVAFGTSLPELVVSLVASAEGDSSIAIGNIVGSNIANIGLILGLAAAIATVQVDHYMIRREIPLLIGCSLLFIILSWNGQLGLTEGVILAAGLLAFTYYSFSSVRERPEQAEEAVDTLEAAEALDEEIAGPSTHPLRDVGLIVIGLVGLIVGAEWLVNAAESIARALGVSELVIGLTLVAVGTSLPELATTLSAVRRNEADIAVGNVIGSNLFNMLFIGGVSAAVRTLDIPAQVLAVDYWVMLAITILVFVMALPKPHRLQRWHGLVLLAFYSAYTIWLFLADSTPPA